MKSEVYSWGLSPEFKANLEEAARRERVSVARLLERIARDWLKARAASGCGRSRCSSSARIGAAIRTVPQW